MLLRFVPASGEHLDWEGAVWDFVCLAVEAGATHWISVSLFMRAYITFQLGIALQPLIKKYEFDNGIHVQRSSLLAVVNFS